LSKIWNYFSKLKAVEITVSPKSRPKHSPLTIHSLNLIDILDLDDDDDYYYFSLHHKVGFELSWLNPGQG